MKITDIEIRLCKHATSAMKDSEMRDGIRSDLEFLVISMKTDAGIQADTFDFAGRGAKIAGQIAADWICIGVEVYLSAHLRQTTRCLKAFYHLLFI